jgi:hypothetical protein
MQHYRTLTGKRADMVNHVARLIKVTRCTGARRTAVMRETPSVRVVLTEAKACTCSGSHFHERASCSISGADADRAAARMWAKTSGASTPEEREVAAEEVPDTMRLFTCRPLMILFMEAAAGAVTRDKWWRLGVA